MVQIIKAPRSAAARFSDALLGAMDERKKLEGQKELVQEKFLQEVQKQKYQKEQDLESQRTMAEYFGPDFAEVWAIQYPDGKNAMIREAISARKRGLGMDTIIKKYKAIGNGGAESSQTPEAPIPGETPQIKEETETGDAIGQAAAEESLFDIREEDLELPPLEEFGFDLTPEEEIAAKKINEAKSFELNKDYIKHMNEIGRDLPIQKRALDQLRMAKDAGNFNSIQNILATILHADFLKTAEAQVVNSAAKTFLMSSLSGLTGRPNQFLERQITKSIISPLYKKEANELIYKGMEDLYKIKEYEINTFQKLHAKYVKERGEVPRNFQEIVNQKVRKKAIEYEKRYEKKWRDLLGSKKTTLSDGKILMEDANGRTLHVPTDKVDYVLDNDGFYK